MLLSKDPTMVSFFPSMFAMVALTVHLSMTFPVSHTTWASSVFGSTSTNPTLGFVPNTRKNRDPMPGVDPKALVIDHMLVFIEGGGKRVRVWLVPGLYKGICP